MNSVYVNSKMSDDDRRAELYNGQLFVYTASPAVQNFCAFARQLVLDAFCGLDPLRVHEALPVERCVEILADLKPRFIHDPRSKRFIQAILAEHGCDPGLTYFDVPRLRTAFPSDYLTSGIAYAFHPHRDTWYSAPPCQLNWWLPVFEVNAENVMAFHPRHWSTPVKNGSRNYNYYQWNAENRKNAAQHVRADTRVQPKPEEDIELDPQIRIVTQPGDVLVFSAAHLHSTVPNTSGLARYSIDFRTIHADDARNRRGAPNLDAECTGTTMRDYLRITDLSRVPEEIVALYDDGTEVQGHLIYTAQDASATQATTA